MHKGSDFDLSLCAAYKRRLCSAGLSENDYDVPAQAKVRSFADAALSRNQNVPATWEVRESKPLAMSDEANQPEDLFLQNDSDDNGMQQKIVRIYMSHLLA